MRKTSLLFGVLALVGVLFVACSDQQDLTSPEDAAFGKGGGGATYTCSDLTVQAQKDVLEEAVDVILLNVKSRKGAHQNVDNMARKVCAEPPDYDAALLTYSKFEIEINLQNVDKLEGGETGRQALLHMAYMFASGGDYNPGFSIPPEAFGPDGGLFVIPSPGDIPPEGLELVANGYEGALRVLPGTFPDDAFPVTVVEYRLPDDYTGEYPYDFGDYAGSLTPEIWFFDASAPVDPAGPGVEVWVCLVEDLVNDPFLYDRSVIAHATDEGGVELLDGDDRLTENPPAELDCAGAGAYQTASAATSGWRQLAASVLRPVTSFLGVKPLNAMYFAGKGLGGRGGALSPFGPVDVLSLNSLTVTVNGNSDAAGTLYDHVVNGTVSQGEILVSSFSCTLAAASCLIEGIPAGATVTLTAVFDDSTSGNVEWSGRCDGPGDGTTCQFTMTEGDLISGTFFRVFNTLTVDGAGSGTGIVTGGNGINCAWNGTANSGQCQTSVEPWVNLVLTATASSGSSFTGWSGACTGTGECSVPMDSDKAVTATFATEVVTIGSTLTVTITQDGGPGAGTVVTDNHDHICYIGTPCPPWTYTGPEVAVTITATPDPQGSGSTGVEISGACTWGPGAGYGPGSCNFTAFEGNDYNLTTHFITTN